MSCNPGELKCPVPYLQKHYRSARRCFGRWHDVVRLRVRSQPLTQGYLLASAEQVVKTPEGKCGEGKCGDASMAKTDTDGDGKVSRAEFLKVAPKSNFDKIDTNHDGFIDEQEASTT